MTDVTPEQIAELQEFVVIATTGLDTTWVMVAAILVMFMQMGFTMLEAGTVRAKNTQGILTKNLLDSCIGALCWWCVGYGIAFGEDKGKFIGGNLFVAQDQDFALGPDGGLSHYVLWFFQWAFCATAATIVSGAVAERIHLIGYSIFMVVMTCFIYPVVVHWTWGGGWLSDGDEGMYTDFAGSGIVHLCGGVAALVGAIVLGPRTGRFEDANDDKFVPHNIPLVVLGTFVLWFGWYGFNAGSTVSMTGANANTAALVAVTTTLSAASGGIVVFLLKFAQKKKHDVCGLANGILAGLVSITAPCDGVYGWTAILIGGIGGFVYFGASSLLKKLKIDDPLDAFAVHGACGMWGVLSVAFFNSSSGIFYGGENAGNLLGWQLCGIVAIAAWTGGLSLITFMVLNHMGILRISLDEEEGGSDEKAPSKSYVMDDHDTLALKEITETIRQRAPQDDVAGPKKSSTDDSAGKLNEEPEVNGPV